MKKRNSILSFRKGNAVTDTITVLVFLLVFVIIGITAKYVFNEVNDDMQANPDMGNTTKDTVGAVHARSGNFLDGLFLFFFILIWALMIVASFMVDSHPIFFIFTIILMVFVFFLGALLGNVYEGLTDDAELDAVIAADFPITDWIMSHFLLSCIVVGFSIIIVLFGKNRASQ